MVEEDYRQRIEQALKSSQARFTEIRLEESVGSRVIYRGKRLEGAYESLNRGGFVRCLAAEGGWGTATFNDLHQLGRKVGEALACARAISAPRVDLAPVEPVECELRASLEQDFREVPLSEKLALLKELNEAMLAEDEAIASTSAIYFDRMQVVYYGNSEGAWIVEERPLIDLYCIAEAVRGDDVQSSEELHTLANRGFEVCAGRQERARAVARRARRQLDAKPVKGGCYPVVLNPSLASLFVHEAFGHMSESDFLFENEEAQKAMPLGRVLGRPFLNITDSGVDEEGGHLPGTHAYDDEGVPMSRTPLIKDGVLVGRLHSRETAHKMGEEPTGNARAQDYNHAPIVRMRNTFIEPGQTSFEDMISDIDLGVYALDSRGGETGLGAFSFSSAYAYMIRDGKLAEPVRDVILAGNLFETLQNVTAIGDDFRWDCSGRCGKEGQHIPVGSGSPHIRIENLVIGGE